MNGWKQNKMVSRCCWMGMLLCVLCGAEVWAQSAQETQTARRIYIEGARFMQQKRYEEASVQFRLAYRLLSRQRDPKVQGALRKLRYFLGFCYFQLKNWDDAKKFLSLYLKTTTNQASRRYVQAQKMLATAERQIALRPRRRPLPRVVRRPPPPPRPRVVVIEKPVPVAPPPRTWRAGPFVVLGVGAAGLIASGIMGFLTNNAVQERDTAHKNLLDHPDPASTAVAGMHRKAETFAVTTNILLISGGVLSTLGVILIATVGRAPAKVPVTNMTKSLGKSHLLLPEVTAP